LLGGLSLSLGGRPLGGRLFQDRHGVPSFRKTVVEKENSESEFGWLNGSAVAIIHDFAGNVKRGRFLGENWKLRLKFHKRKCTKMQLPIVQRGESCYNKIKHKFV
jgi:hypothetical protein